uniref:Uncharacterized protein n=1 Tax=Oryzias melastigma TaxID=30732 RepID=A0A3B3DT61_ORYME
MTEDHGLSDGDGSVDVTESLKLLLLAVTQHIILFDGVQSLLLPLQFDDVGLRNDALSKVPDRLLERSRKQQHLANKHFDLLWIYKLELAAPVQHGTGNNIFTDEGLTFISSNGINQFDFRVIFAHLLDHFASLQRQLISGRHTQTLKRNGRFLLLYFSFHC